MVACCLCSHGEAQNRGAPRGKKIIIPLPKDASGTDVYPDCNKGNLILYQPLTVGLFNRSGPGSNTKLKSHESAALQKKIIVETQRGLFNLTPPPSLLVRVKMVI